ncbi:DUF6402 family protein [Collimonas humicola]|uniref:DUF6402 family protein n=1 Tax=Collimonas humicola TaxID=2825886 RepID=UPI001B8C9B45|nr:DUF6402 family protein [Collimonas humicola]
MHESAEKLPYFKPDPLWWTWEKQEGSKGCYKVDQEEIFLATDMRPPPLRDQPPPDPVAPVAAAPKPFSIEKIGYLGAALVKLADFVDWMEEPALVKKPPPPPEPDEKTLPAPAVKRIKPFDIQEIPSAMEKLGWKISAKLMRKWFAGQLNYPNNDEGDEKQINQLGQPFPPSMIDTSTITMDWILSFPRARRKFEELQGNAVIQSTAARDELKKICLRHLASGCKYTLNAWEEVDHDIQQLHRQYQFQLHQGSDYAADSAVLLPRTNTAEIGVPDDLLGALGSFMFYAALGYAQFEWLSPKKVKATVTHIVVYMKDTYSFYDRSTHAGSQYLGHWNRNGARVVPVNLVLSVNRKNNWFDYPIATNLPWKTTNVYYPVYNKDFRNWQKKYQQGGDFLLFSDPKTIRLTTPITMELAP